MAGYDSPYVPGWDCHGLPIEIKVDSQLGPAQGEDDRVRDPRTSAASTPPATCELQPGVQAARRLRRWDNPYLTMSAEYEAVIARAFVDFLDQGYVYKGLKPVNWCIHCRTALAEAEVEYENHTSPSIWVRFPLHVRPGRHRPGPGRARRLRPHLDHHALDPSRQHGHRVSPRL
jgi:isoleucyl-tRNA synthetase